MPMNLEEEFARYKKYCKGLILNVGSGSRPLKLGPYHLLTDIDLSFPIHFASDAHCLPVKDETMDTIVNVAVLEHTAYPWKVVAEFFRVLKPGGHAIVAVPFLQPEHNMPDDYYRFTSNGIRRLFESCGFEVVEVNKVVNTARTLAWILIEKIKQYSKLIRVFLLPACHVLSKMGGDDGKPDSTVYRGVYLVARKPGDSEIEAPDMGSDGWFYPYLCCPISRKSLRPGIAGDSLCVDGDARRYRVVQGGLISSPAIPGKSRRNGGSYPYERSYCYSPFPA